MICWQETILALVELTKRFSSGNATKPAPTGENRVFAGGGGPEAQLMFMCGSFSDTAWNDWAGFYRLQSCRYAVKLEQIQSIWVSVALVVQKLIPTLLDKPLNLAKSGVVINAAAGNMLWMDTVKPNQKQMPDTKHHESLVLCFSNRAFNNKIEYETKICLEIPAQR